MQNNFILNQEYSKSNFFFETGHGSYVYSKKKKFLDLGYCAGTLLLGHNHKVLRESFKLLSKNKISNLAYANYQSLELAKTLKKILPNYSKFIFCNSGTESVFKSLRLCKALSGKKKIVSVTGSWHGSVDNTLYAPKKNLKPQKLSDGLSDESRKNLVFVPYNDIKNSKKILNKYKNKIQCVIIEPVQGCLPLSDVSEYLKFLENFCKKNNIILFFDEMITGLRTDCKSVQSIYKIKPDISTFGKCFGGGIPIGIIGITKKIENKIKRKKLNIFFGGTFSAGSVNSFIANQNLKYIFKNRKFIFSKINKFGKFFEENINKFCKKNDLDVRISRFHSMAQIVFTKKKIINRIQKNFYEKGKKAKIEKFRNYLFKKKIHYPSSGNIFFAYSLTKKNLQYITNTVNTGLKKYFS